MDTVFRLPQSPPKPGTKRDSSFLIIAVIAGSGGVLAIALSIGIPIWIALHGKPYNPAFSLFAGWGVAALGGCYGSLHTYFLSDTTQPRPPRGGIAVVDFTPIPTPVPAERRAA